MFNEPYLETCCRSALHRLLQCGAVGRPAGLADDGCLERLTAMGFASRRLDGRYEIREEGKARHETEILHIRAEART